MVQKKYISKRKHNKKIHKRVIIQNQQIIEVKGTKKENKSITDSTTTKVDIKEKVKEKKASRIYLTVTLFFLIGLMILFISRYNEDNNKEIKPIHLNYPNIDKIEFSIITRFI